MEKTNKTAFFFCLSFLRFCDLTVCSLVGTNSHLTIRAKTVLSAKLYFFCSALRTQSKRNMKQTDCNFLHIRSVTLGRKTSYLFFPSFFFGAVFVQHAISAVRFLSRMGKEITPPKFGLAGWMDLLVVKNKQIT